MMMDYVLVGATIAFVGISLWLWNIGKHQAGKLGIHASLSFLSPDEFVLFKLLRVLKRSEFGEPHDAAFADEARSSEAPDGFHESPDAAVWDKDIVAAVLKEYHWPEPRFKYQGSGHFPRKVYEGDSKSITVELRPHLTVCDETDREPVHIQKTKDGLSITLQIALPATDDHSVGESLEFELIAAGFSVAGDKKQRQALTSNRLHYQWNCYFPNSGNHTFALVARVVCCQDTSEIGRIEHTIKVAKLDHMTQRQVWVWAAFAGAVSGILGIIEILRKLGLL